MGLMVLSLLEVNKNLNIELFLSGPHGGRQIIDAESVASNRRAPTDLFNTKTDRKSPKDTNGLVAVGSPTLKSVRM